MTPPRDWLWKNAAEGAQFVMLAANLAWTVVCLGGYRPDTQVVTFALGAALGAVHLAWRTITGKGFKAVDFVAWAFLLYAGANIVWMSPAPWLGWAEWSGWLCTFVVYWVVRDTLVSGAWRMRLLVAMIALTAVAAGMALYQRLSNPGWLMMGRVQAEQFVGRSSGCFGIPNSLAALMLLVMPPTVACALDRRAGTVRRVLFGYFALLQGVALYLSVSRGAWLALGGVIIASPLYRRNSAWKTKFVGLAWALGVVAIATAGILLASPEARDRASRLITEHGERSRPILWKAAWSVFEQHPALGGGLGTFDVRFERYRQENFQDDPQWAHNEYLNTLADVGAVGFVLLFGAMAAQGWEKCRSSRSGGEGELAPHVGWATGLGLAAFLVQAFVDFHFKLPGLAMSFAVMAGLWTGTEGAGAVPACRGVERGAMVALAGVVGVMFVHGAWPVLRAEALRYPARREIDHLSSIRTASAADWSAAVARATKAFARATTLGPGDGQAWSDLSFVHALAAREMQDEQQALGRAAEASARRALALCQESYEPWVRLGVALDMEGRWGDAGDAFAAALERAPNAAIPHYYLAYHFAQRATTRAFARSLVETCLRLDPSNGPAQDLQKQLDRP